MPGSRMPTAVQMRTCVVLYLGYEALSAEAVGTGSHGSLFCHVTTDATQAAVWLLQSDQKRVPQ